ncbi:MAG: hypothetical protein BWZ02_02077 [Lentisphaerae bacterium ADurb.BinA184]|nr:MAG: hypothetical protein BWZ02_02077 [Lentisphaerae bacterium ADurb.BinA184]
MPDILQDGIAWLHRRRAEHMASPATYVRAGQAGGVTVHVTASQIRCERLDAAGLPVEACAMDFIASAAELTADPEPGDTILFAGRRCEVTALGGEPCWRWTDAGRLARRIHTRDTGEA